MLTMPTIKNHPQWLTLCVVSCILTGCAWNNDPAMRNDGRALRLVHLLRNAEAKYQAQHGRYADLSALGPSGANLVPKELASGKVNGYEFHIEVSVSGYRLTAWPLVDGKTGFRSLYCDETGAIRQSWGPGRATATSPLVN
jgi:hypothetical protein